jgi:hypothetical protein
MPNTPMPLAPAYAACACGVLVLTGLTTAGERVSVDTGVQTYIVDWTAGTALPKLAQSRAYPVHTCAGNAPHNPRR